MTIKTEKPRLRLG